MEFPALMPKELHYSKEISEDELFAVLVINPADLILFFETASADETWSELHIEFMRKIIEWLTAQAFKDRLSSDFCKRAAKAIYEHSHIIGRLVPQNIEIRLKDDQVQVSSLLMAVASDFFKDIMLRECRDKECRKLAFENTTYEMFAPFKAFIDSGSIPDLWKREQHEVVDILHLASSWRVYGVVKACEFTLKKYLNKQNAIDMLIQAQQELWPYFKQLCIDYINDYAIGFRVKAPTVERLAFEFQDFSESTFEIFQRLKPFITDLICKGTLSENPHFGRVVKLCPKLALLDISGSQMLSEYLTNIPKELPGISLAECSWLKSATLKKMAEICPYLKHLDLTSNFQLNFAAWGELAKFKGLKFLNLSRCHQITDDDFNVILKACGEVTDLILDGCRKIDDRGFFELAKNLPRLTNLSVVHCAISDSAALEIAARCRSLTSFSLMHCDQLTEKGLRELPKHAYALKELNLSDCAVTLKAIQEIQQKHPYLRIIFDVL